MLFNVGVMAKLLSETVDAVDTGPVEAAVAAGASRTQMVRSAVFPQVLPNYVAFSLYIFELNIRASTVIGIVGAGGIGNVLNTADDVLQLRERRAWSCWSCSCSCCSSSSSSIASAGGWSRWASQRLAQRPRRPSHLDAPMPSCWWSWSSSLVVRSASASTSTGLARPAGEAGAPSSRRCSSGLPTGPIMSVA